MVLPQAVAQVVAVHPMVTQVVPQAQRGKVAQEGMVSIHHLTIPLAVVVEREALALVRQAVAKLAPAVLV